MPVNTRSPRQIQTLKRIREWHFSQAMKAKLDGRIEEANFHDRYYDLLGPAVEMTSSAGR